jgi:DNA polymerase I-like protein with 3'-5' exonuclease and polymerase domains
MKTLAFFDIETNGITDWSTLSDLKDLHCLVVIDQNGTGAYRADNIQEGLDRLSAADHIVGHNSIGFDAIALWKLYGYRHEGVLDSAVIARFMFPDIRNDDFKREGFPKPLIGSHSLKAWGYRIGNNKSDHGETEDWSQWSPEMEEYCVQDVEVTKSLYEFFLKKGLGGLQQVSDLEHSFAKIIRIQEMNGFPFDVKAAEKLTATLMGRRAALDVELREVFAPTEEVTKSNWWLAPDGTKSRTKKALVEKGFKPKEITKGEQVTKLIPFNPNSRDQIAERLMANGWKPSAYEGKRPAINEGVLKEIGTTQSEKLLEYLLVTKRLGQVAEGKQAWLKLEKKGRIHGSINTNGAVSGRCTHRNPNVAQTPSGRAPYGEECRSCWTAPTGKVLVGADASGLELRCLAHYLALFGDKNYAKTILEGDIHTANQKAAGLPTRDDAKTFIYAFLYGAGDAKIGSIVGGNAKQGKALKASFMKQTPSIKKLYDAVANALEVKGMLRGIDGRPLPCRSSHSAVNLLLQSAGAVVMKQALVEFTKMAKLPYEMHGNIHDEVQFSCAPEHADELGRTFCNALGKAGKVLKFNCPLDGEYSVGANWKETH